ncbi:MAG: hypothetical protein Q4C09_06335 [Atopobiaceae bacterium]|nr:hypothetical protein [Atopobiaceae bacterium]
MNRSLRWRGRHLALLSLLLVLGACLATVWGAFAMPQMAQARDNDPVPEKSIWFEHGENEWDDWLFVRELPNGNRMGTLTVQLNTSQFEDVEFQQLWRLIKHNEGGEDEFFDEALTVDVEQRRATIDASELPGDLDGIELCASIFQGEVHQDNFLADARFWIQIVEEEEHYDQEESAFVVTNDQYYLDKQYHGFVRNKDYPYGEDFDYAVTKVEIESQEPDEQGQTVVELDPNAEQQGVAAILNAKSHGRAIIKMTCEDIRGLAWSYTFPITVQGSVYYAWVGARGTDMAVPGGTITLHATGLHRAEGQPDQRDGFTYKWELAPNNDVFVEKLEENAEDNTLTVTFKSEKELRAALGLSDEDFLDETLRVRATLVDEGEERVSSNYYWARVCQEYEELYPTSLEDAGIEKVDVGQTVEFPLEVRSITAGQDGYTLVEGVKYELNFDDKAITLSTKETTDDAGNKVTMATLTRKSPRWTEFSVVGSWQREDGSPAHYNRQYSLDNAECELSFEGDQIQEVAPECAKRVTLDATQLKNVEGRLQINVGKVHFAEGSFAPIFDEELSQEDGEYSVQDDGNGTYVIIVPGDSLVKHNLDEVGVLAAFFYGDDADPLSADMRTLKLNKELGHKLEEVKVSTVVSSNWYCPECDKLFADHEATKHICPMYRLYNPNSGEHFYTADAKERADVIAAGWNDEQIGWFAPADDKSVPVYRLYNSFGGEHHYTMDPAERDMLIEHKWTDEGIGWYSDPAQAVPLLREYNPNQYACNHNYTTERAEHDHLVSLGWKDEGTAWYAVKPGK